MPGLPISLGRRIDHSSREERTHAGELHARRHAESGTFAMFVYEKIGERLLRHFTCSNENDWQALKWCEEN
jgi:hypothetical protein